ncbi:hypothetical protein OX284_007155 [Flavobacterium sp. SUN046]|uniref:hypothetical protein n=1 Tax=Flavobacterium sp. SUN046 TaxID=3002440 RepID=UPI002DBC85C9|nr:hypothetical protein [Flavobacterium sp. SUN046]MEC4049202.1 hypothetical protein [Flavobacterium sp. SUN046]
MKKIFFAAVVVATISMVSCTSESVENKADKTLSNKSVNDTTGGQNGTIPPPRP